MISYAQNAEDVLLRRVLHDVSGGFYIDVGASEPIHQSVTKHFYEEGWRGVNIEPETRTGVFERLSADRPRDVNLNLGLSDREGSLTFHEATSAPGWSTFSTDQLACMLKRGITIVERQVAVTTLAKVCEEHVFPGQEIDFLKVDAESHELEVLRGGNWSRWRPRVVLVEDNGVSLWEHVLIEANYQFAFFDGINRFYLRQEDLWRMPAFAVPVCVLDDFVPYKFLRPDLPHPPGPLALRIARRIQDFAVRHPRISTLARRALGA